jgi:hypothetical protein
MRHRSASPITCQRGVPIICLLSTAIPMYIHSIYNEEQAI